MPHGILFRGGAEGKIRQGIVEADLFEAVIGLAPNLFSGASIPVAICVLNKAKPAERHGKVLFVDAAQDGSFRHGKARNYIDKEHIGRIVEAYRAFEDVDRFAHVADLEEMRANDFNLNISRYVDTTEPSGSDERRRRLGAASGRRAAAGRGGGKDGRVARGAGVCPIGVAGEAMPTILREGPYRFFFYAR